MKRTVPSRSPETGYERALVRGLWLLTELEHCMVTAHNWRSKQQKSALLLLRHRTGDVRPICVWRQLAEQGWELVNSPKAATYLRLPEIVCLHRKGLSRLVQYQPYLPCASGLPVVAGASGIPRRHQIKPASGSSTYLSGRRRIGAFSDTKQRLAVRLTDELRARGRVYNADRGGLGGTRAEALLALTFPGRSVTVMEMPPVSEMSAGQVLRQRSKPNGRVTSPTYVLR
ncbi:hypothetical protein KCP73_01935 [Salmonella enterica subsp. enterica]|nr:hypothetical protein KCP73_01935 [Salmonella enterica subsp. enterica]